MNKDYKNIPLKAWFSTAEVAELLGVSTTTIVTYARKSDLHEQLIRRRRGDYVFSYEQVALLRDFAFAFDEEE